MINGIKPIETLYKGYRFRSRLEARWAVFFDALGVEWEYEPEGFDLGDGLYYLPDFYLPEMNLRVEVKPADAKLFNFTTDAIESISGEDSDKIMRFVNSMDFNQYFMVVRGDPRRVFLRENEGDDYALPDFFFKGFAVCSMADNKVFDETIPRGEFAWRLSPDGCFTVLHNCECDTCKWADEPALCHSNVVAIDDDRIILDAVSAFFHPVGWFDLIFTAYEWRDDGCLTSYEKERTVGRLMHAMAKARQARFEHGETPR